MNRVEKEERNQGDLSSSGLKLLSSKKGGLAKEIEIFPTNEMEENRFGGKGDPYMAMARRETQVLYKRNSPNRGSKGSIQDEIRIYDNPFTSYYTASERENDERLRCFSKRSFSFYLRDAFCPIRRAFITAICCVFAVLVVSLMLNGQKSEYTSSKYD